MLAVGFTKSTVNGYCWGNQNESVKSSEKQFFGASISVYAVALLIL
jgi:hypothetical protein